MVMLAMGGVLRADVGVTRNIKHRLRCCPRRMSGGDIDALAPGRAVPVRRRRPPVGPGNPKPRLGLRVVRALHVREAEADRRPNLLLVEPLEARPEVRTARALDDDLVRKVVRRVFRRVLRGGVDLGREPENDSLFKAGVRDGDGPLIRGACQLFATNGKR